MLGRLLCLSLVLGTGAIAVFGQATGAITGTVLDQSRAAVPGATVTVRSLDTNAARSAAADAEGRFHFPGLALGRYEVSVRHPGFARFVQGAIHLALNQVAVVEPELSPATVLETVVVSEDAAMLNTTTAEVGVRFDGRHMGDLPLGGQFGAGGGFRDVFSTVLSAPGVTQLNTGNQSFASGVDFSANGMRTRGNNFMVDGQDSNDPTVTGRQQALNNPDMVQEVRLITNQFLAEYGRSAGSVVNVITRSGANSFHGSALWFYNSNALNSRSNLDLVNFKSAPFINEHQFGGTLGGPIRKDHTFFFGSLQRWTRRQQGSGVTIRGVPTEEGRQLLRQVSGERPQVQALLKFLPAAQAPLGSSAPLNVNGRDVPIPLGSLTNIVASTYDDWQSSGRVDQQLGKHSLGGRYLFDDGIAAGDGQGTPSGLTTDSLGRTQALTVWLTSSLTPRALNELRLSWQRLGVAVTSSDPASETIPSIEITALGLRGFNAGPSRTALGLAVNLPQLRTNNTYQVQESFSWTSGAHALKFGADLRRVQVKSFFFPTIRGLLRYADLQTFVDDFAEAASINLPLPGGEATQYYQWHDHFLYAQDTWSVRPGLSLSYGLRYETPGNALASMFPINDRIVRLNGGHEALRLDPRPRRDTNNFQPRFGFSGIPRVRPPGAFAPGRRNGLLARLLGNDKLVVRGGYARSNDYAFLNIALNVASAYPFVGALGSSNLRNAFAVLPTMQPDLSDPAQLKRQFTRTIVGKDFRSPVAEQFSLEIQRQVTANTIFRAGYIATKGTALFQTLDGNPRSICSPIPVSGCPRLDATSGVLRIRANSASSIYHSMQLSVDRRLTRGFSAGAHYTWSAFIDDASEIFNPSTRGEVAVPQDSFNRRADRGRSTYDRPHRFVSNFVWELPAPIAESGAMPRRLVNHLLGGWQIGSFITLQGGSPFTPLNGSDPARALDGISSAVGNAIRPNLNTTLDLSSMKVEELIRRGGAALFATLPRDGSQRVGLAGRNVLRSDGISHVDFSVVKNLRLAESHRLQFRADMFNLTNSRNFGIPESSANNPEGFGYQWGTDGGRRRIYVSLRYVW